MRAGAAVLLVAIVAGLAGGRLASGADLSEAQTQEGLAKLSTMMAADMPATARWVLVESHGRRWAGIFSQGEDVFPTEGNAFLLEEKPGKEARILVVSTGAVFKVRAEDSPEASSAADMQAMPRVFPSSWKNANVTKDVNAAAEWLRKKIKKEGVSKASTSPGITFGMNGAPMFGNDDSGDPDAAYFQTALVWAALLHRTGHTSEAMSLAQIALSGTDEKKRKQMLDALFSRVANGGYQRAMTEFGQHHDWAKLRDELDALVKKFPQGWSNRDAVRVVLHHVTARAQLPAEAPLKTRQTLPEADQKVLLAWLKEMEAGKPPSYTRWTLPPIKSEVVDAETDADAGLDLEEAVKRQGTVGVKSNTFPDSHGLAAVPLLASLLTDETLTTAGTAMQGGYSRTYFSGGGDEDPASRVRTAYNSLIKPHTRAELAWQTLQHVLPSEMRHSSDDEDSAGRADEVLQWYASVKTASPDPFTMKSTLLTFALFALLCGHSHSQSASKRMIGTRPLPDMPGNAFTIVIIPDTQTYRGKGTKPDSTSTDPTTNANLAAQVQWIRDHRADQNIVFVSHVGDIVDKNNVDQWAVAKLHLDTLRGVVPFSLTVGNHDMTAKGDAHLFQQHFPAATFKDYPWYLGSYTHDRKDQNVSANNVNSAQLFSAGGMDFIHLSLECNAPDDVLAWANDLLTKHAARRALITTHMDLGILDRPKTEEGFIHDPKGRMRWIKIHGARGNTGEQMWDKLFRKHANLRLICCGDQSRVTALQLTTPADDGHPVTSMLSDYMSQPVLRLLRFVPAENKVHALTYDVSQRVLVDDTPHVHELAQHQFTIDYPMQAAPRSE